MVDTLLDDIKELLLKEKGDPKILERIRRAAERDEVISVFERAYVKKLVDQHLRPPPEITPEPTNIPEEKVEYDLEPKVAKPIPVAQKLTTEKKPKDSTKEDQKTKMMIGIGAAALAVILIVGISMSGIPAGTFSPSSEPIIPTPETQEGPLTIETDLSSYELADIISISGRAETSGESLVEVSIENTQKSVIWKEDLNLKDSGEFSTLVLAGGPGWEDSGEYILKVKHGSLFKEISFTFNS